jgi:hypothetical protein
MTGLVVVERLRGRLPCFVRRGSVPRHIPQRWLRQDRTLAAERIVARLDAALRRRRPDRERDLVFAGALDVNRLLDLRVADLEAEGARQHGIGEVEDQIGDQQDQQAARLHALLYGPSPESRPTAKRLICLSEISPFACARAKRVAMQNTVPTFRRIKPHNSGNYVPSGSW